MPDLILYALTLFLGCVLIASSRHWQRARPSEFHGGFQALLSFAAGGMFFALLAYAFLCFPWWVGIAAPLAAWLLAKPFVTYSPWLDWAEERGIQRSKNAAELMFIGLNLALWARYTSAL